MKKTKAILIFLTIFAMAFMASGCNSSKENNNNKESFQQGDLNYKYNDDKSGVIICDSKQATGDIEIPSSINSLPVVSIGDYAFYESSITSIVIPNGVTSIGENAFRNCESLTSVELPNTLTSIGLYAFGTCKSLKSLIIPNGVTKIETGTFIQCSSLENIEIPDSVTSIGESAFMDCYSLKSIEIPNVTTIESYTFYHCYSLRYIIISEGVTNIKEYAFFVCKNILKLILPSTLINIGKDAFSKIDHFIEIFNLSNFSESEINEFIGSNVVLQRVFHTSLNEKSVLTEDENGFIFAYVDNTGYLVSYNDWSKEELILPDNFIYDGNKIQSYAIGDYAFYIESNVSDDKNMVKTLKSVTISKGVSLIKCYAFYGFVVNFNKLNKTVNYAGKMDEWEQIVIESLAYNKINELANRKIKCTDGELFCQIGNYENN